MEIAREGDGSDQPLSLDDAPVRGSGPREILIAELVANDPGTSVRLRNCIELGAYDRRLPCRTVGEYLDAGSVAPVLFMGSLRSFGRRTAHELDHLVRAYVGRAGVHAVEEDAPSSVCDADEARRALLLERLRTLSFSDAVAGEVTTTRLQHALSSPELGDRKVVELLTGGAAFRAELRRIPNFGRTSLDELEQYCRRAVVRALAQADADRTALTADCSLLFGIYSDEAVAALGAFIENTLVIDLSPGGDAESILRWAMRNLSDREVEVLARRYGLEGTGTETLEEIGVDFDVTRERIRQLESKGLRKLRRTLAGGKLGRALERAAAAFWDAREADFLPAPERLELRRSLPPYVLLALDVAELRSREWLEASGTVMANGVLRPGREALAVRELAARLQEAARKRVLPAALVELVPGEEESDLEVAACAETFFPVAEGYLFKFPPRVRMKRAVRLHAILARERRAMTLYELGDEYCGRVPGDRCGLRDLVIVMETLPQLFVEIEEGLWAALGEGSEPRADARELETAPDVPPEVDSATIAGALQEALTCRGPTSVGDLYRDGDSIVPSGRSRISIGPILLGRPDLFRRVLPGVYALPEQLLSPAEMLTAPLPFLLNPGQARIYAFARRAGEAWGTFPLWTSAAEYRLCCWARFEAEPALFHSLLAIARIGEWPLSETLKQEWWRLAEQRGRFELASPRSARAEPRPALDRVLAACIIARDRGAICWMLINRIMGKRIDALGAKGLLALMVALGVVRPPPARSVEDWQLAHPATEVASRLAGELSRALARTGELSWESPLGEEVAARALAAQPEALGWASVGGVAELLGTEAAPSIPATAGEEEAEDIFDRLMGEHRRTVEHVQRQAMAQWLLEE